VVYFCCCCCFVIFVDLVVVLVVDFVLMLFVFFGNSQSAKQIFESPDLKSMLYTAKTVAILPFKVSISYKRLPKNVTLE
jgi:hypothetical protein